MSKLIKEEEQDNKLNCSKGDKDLKSENESILIVTPKINDNYLSKCKEKYDQYTSTDWFKYVELETFDTLCDGYIEFKNYIEDTLNGLNFGKEFNCQTLYEANNDVNSIKQLEVKINELKNERKQLNDEYRTLSEIIKLVRENKCITGSKYIADDGTNKWEVVKSSRNKTN